MCSDWIIDEFISNNIALESFKITKQHTLHTQKWLGLGYLKQYILLFTTASSAALCFILPKLITFIAYTVDVFWIPVFLSVCKMTELQPE